jgi:hypothetical protein
VLSREEAGRGLDGINEIRSAISNMSIWLEPAFREDLLDLCAGLESFIEVCKTQLSDKGIELARALESAHPNRRIGFMCPSRDVLPSIENFVQQQRPRSPVYGARSIRATEFLDELIMLAWPGQKKWEHFRNANLSRDILFLCYPFELRWLNQYRNSEAMFLANQSLAVETKSDLTDFAPDLFHAPEGHGVTDTAAEGDNGYAFNFEPTGRASRKDGNHVQPSGSTSRARYIGFAGDTFAYLSEGYNAAVITDIIRGIEGADVKWTDVDDLAVGEIVLFRDGAHADLLGELCSKQYDDYAMSRYKANTWRRAINEFRKSRRWSAKEMARWLRNKGIDRNLQSILGWIECSHVIAPQHAEDIQSIAKVLGDTRLEADYKEVFEHARRIRSYHQTIGQTLTESVIDFLRNNHIDLSDGETELDLKIGRAWIVEVEFVNTETENVAVSLINRLRWRD